MASENENLDRLTEAIKLLQDDSNSGPNNDANADEEGVAMEDSSEPENTIDDAVQFCKYEKTLDVVGTKFFKILGCKTKHKMIDTLAEGVSHLYLNNMEAVSITNIQSFQTLQS